MLEQAFIDADSLKETALKNAESIILEKYSSEVKKAIDNLLEEEVMEETADETVEEELEDIPNAHYQEEELDEDQEIDIDLDKLAEELNKEGSEETLEEIEEIEQALEEDTEELEESEEEELDITEEQINSIIEKLTVDVKNVPSGQPGGASNKALDRENEEIALAQEDVEELEEDEEKEDLEESINQLKKEKDALLEQNQKYKSILLQAKEKLEEVNLSNARLLYTNRVLGNPSLNERQKTKIVEALSNAGSVEEAKVIHETLQSAVGSSRKRNPQSLSEAVTRNTSTTIPRRKDENKSNSPNNRWKTLAGIK
jgi:hypothetical protein